MAEFKKYGLLENGQIKNMYWETEDGKDPREYDVEDGDIYVYHDEPFRFGSGCGFALMRHKLIATSDDEQELEEIARRMDGLIGQSEELVRSYVEEGEK